MENAIRDLPVVHPLRGITNARAFTLILVLSGLVFAFLVWLVYLKKAAGVHSEFVAMLPAVNAGFNSISTVLLSAGFIAVLKKKYQLHQRLMSGALVSSALFLVCYIIYHNAHGDTIFPKNRIKPFYLTVLFSHIAMSALAVPLILSSFYLSLSGRYSLHRRVSRFTFPIWLYVSVTGVVVFVMLKAYVQ